MSAHDDRVAADTAAPLPGARRPTFTDVARAYRLFLGRNLESAAMAGFHIGNSPDLWDLVEAVAGCAEAKRQRACEVAAEMRALQHQPPFDVDVTPEQLDALRRITLDGWATNGPGQYDAWLHEHEDWFAKRSVRWNVEKSVARGAAEANALLALLRHLGWSAPADATITVLGTQAFRMQGAVPNLVALELVESDLTLSALAPPPPAGTSLRAESVRDYAGDLPDTDIFYSVSALQYAPPPLAIDILRCCLGRVRPGGIAAFQLPSHLYAYQFDTAAYLSGAGRDPGGELHCVPQARVFALLRREGFEVIDITPDSRAGKFGLSYFFVAQKTARPALLRPEADAAPFA